MKTFTRLILITLLFTLTVAAQTPPAPDAKELGAIAGRVTNEGQPARGVPVVLMPSEWSQQMKPVAKATTDEQGRYRMAKVPPGRYRLTPLVPGYVFAETGSNPWEPGQTINVQAGDDVQSMNFTLTRGGVVTGRVTDADGKPVVEEYVKLLPAGAEERKRNQFFFQPFRFATDDRGVYRLYGLPTGRYLVFVGEAKDGGGVRGGDIGAFYAQTFYPGAEEEAQAKAIEVTTGAEVSGIDITLGKLKKTYEVAGRVLDEEGQPVVGARYMHGPVSAENRFNGGFGSDDGRTSERGEFRAKGFTPGRWAIWASTGDIFSNEQTTTYSDAVPFEVVDRNVSGVEIKLFRGASVSGVVQIEGTSDPAVLAKLPDLKIGSDWSSAGALTPPRWSQVQVKPNGGFQITGLRPGKTVLSLGWGAPKGFTLLGVERDGLDQPQGIEVRAGEQIKNVRISIAYGTGVLRGQLQFQNGARPQGAILGVMLNRAGSAARVGYAEVDSLGRFVVENLSAGDYEIKLFDYSQARGSGDQPPLLKKTFSISGDGRETQLTLVYDLSAAGGKDDKEND